MGIFGKKLHIVGIGGTAMVAGARLALEAGLEVRGSDNKLYPPTSEMVASLGVPVFEGYAAGNLDWQPDLVLIGNALSRGNPEVEAVLERRLPYTSLPEWLRWQVLPRRYPIMVAGAHGKTTTTALLAHVFSSCGYDPGFFVGGQPLNMPHSAQLGAEEAPFIIEGDEYDTAFFDKRAKFFHYLPHIAVVTSLEFDHADIYADLAAVERAFQLMLRQTPRTGRVLLCADNHARDLAEHAYAPVLTYGFDEAADWRGVSGTVFDGRTPLSVYHKGEAWGEMEAPVAGRHNLQNVLAAVAAAAEWGAPPEQILRAVESFRGVRRRMEVFLEWRGATFVDDFAHHPTALAGVIAAARDRWPDRRLRLLFEPRSNTTTTRRFQLELQRAMSGADEVLIGPIHRGERIPAAERLDCTVLAASLAGAGVAAHAAESSDAIAQSVLASLASNDLILICSNGAFGGIYSRFREAAASPE